MDSIDKTFISSLFHSNYYNLYHAIDIYVAKVAINILRKMNALSFLSEDFRTVDQISGKFGFKKQSVPLLHWMLDYLEQMGHVQRKQSAYRIVQNTFDTDTKKDIDKIMQLEPSSDSFIDMIDRIMGQIDDFFYGKKDGSDILFADPELSDLWNKYFNNYFYGYAVLNFSVAHGILKWFSQTNGKKMLEIGSGTSGASSKVFSMLRDNNLLDSMDNITLTDVFPALLDVGASNIRRNVSNPPDFSQKILDVNKSLDEQGFQEPLWDIIYGINVMHVARDLEYSLGELYNHLDDNGILVIAETIRPSDNKALHQEFMANLLEGYYNVKCDIQHRPIHGFLTKGQWISFFQKAGFRNIEFITELDRHDGVEFDVKPYHSVLVIKGQK